MTTEERTDEAERARAVLAGQRAWGKHGSATEHRRYVLPMAPGRGRRRSCSCGCGQPSTHQGYANGVALTGGCELSMRRWAR